MGSGYIRSKPSAIKLIYRRKANMPKNNRIGCTTAQSFV